MKKMCGNQASLGLPLLFYCDLTAIVVFSLVKIVDFLLRILKIATSCFEI